MRINNNLIAINTHRQMGISQTGAAKSMEKLSSGFRINRAGDDAAGLAISEKMRGQIRGLNQASRNAQDTISLIQTAEGALAETHEILQRMRELSVQAANDTNTDADRKELQSEVQELIKEVDRIANTTEFNTRKLLEGSARGVADEVPATARINNNSQVSLDAIKMTAMVENIGNDKSWAFDGAFMLIKTNQTVNADGTAIYNANDFKLVGPDGKMYDFKELGIDTKIKASELEGGTIIADGGALVAIPTADKLNDAANASAGITDGITIGKAVTHTEFKLVGSGSVLASGSTFTLVSGGSINILDGNGGGDLEISYTAAGVLQIMSPDGNRAIDIESGSTLTLDDGTILRNNGGGRITVESGSITLNEDMLFNGAYPTPGDHNVSAFSIASQSTIHGDSETARADIVLTRASNYLVESGELSTNVVIGNGVNLTANLDSDSTKMGDITLLKEGSILARGSNVELLTNGGVTSIKVMVNGNEVTISYDDTDTGILKVGNDVVPPGKSITLDDGTILTHSATLNDPNEATGKIIVEVGKLIMAEDISADAQGNLQNVKGFSLAKDSMLKSGSRVDTDDGTPSTGTRLMAGTVITDKNSSYPGSVTLGANGASIQFSANTGATMEARYNEARVGETLTFIFSRYEAAANSLRDSVMAQIGANSGQTAFVSVGDMRAAALNVNNVDISSKFGAATAIETINNALQRVSHQRALLGAMQNRLEHTIKNLNASAENLQAAESRIRDVDMAREIMTFTKDNILQQSAQAMLAQANQIPQNVLQLLR